MKKIIHKIEKSLLNPACFWAIILVAVFFIHFAGAAELTNPIESQTFGDLMVKVAQTAVKIGLPIAVIAFIWTGLQFVLARGNDTKLEKARESFMWVVIGTAILMGAWALAEAIRDIVAGL